MNEAMQWRAVRIAGHVRDRSSRPWLDRQLLPLPLGSPVGPVAGPRSSFVFLWLAVEL